MDPYKVLGVTPDASDEDIKKAYRRLSRMYHPDANVNNPDKAGAEEKFKQVQQAYKMIMDGRVYGNSYRNTSNGSYGYGYGSSHQESSYDGPDSRYYAAAANYIRNRRFQEALRVLGEIKNKSGRWYYYSAVTNAGLGNTVTANEHLRTAMELEPDNIEYRQAYMQMQGQTMWYSGMENRYGMPTMNVDNMCLKLCIANLFCNICCGSGGCFFGPRMY